MKTRTKISASGGRSGVGRAVLGAAVAALAWGGAARAENFFWLGGSNTAPVTGITPSIFLTDQNVAEVDAFLAKQGAGTKMVKIETPLSQSTVNAIFNKYKVDYTFMDYEGAAATQNAMAAVAKIRGSSLTGGAIAANKAFVSNYRYSTAAMDPAGPAGVVRPGMTEYSSIGLNMVSDDLYPGSWSYKGPASGNSTAPNIRSALFTLPVARLSTSTATLPAGHVAVPYVNRFNNWGNGALDTDGNSANGFRFVTSNQLPSRADFRAQVLHYRLRGAAGVHGLDGGVEGYTAEQFQEDITAGWNGVAVINDIFARPDKQLATLDTKVKTDGVSKSVESAGVVFSGAYSLSAGKLAMLVSNLDEKAHKVTMPVRVGGRAMASEITVDPGEHQVVAYGLGTTGWRWISTTEVFASTDADRSGVGVPEPTGLAIAGVVGCIGLARRRRRA